MNDYEMGVTHRFAAFCKKVLKLSAYKWYAKRKKHDEREISLSLVYEEYEMDFQDPKEYFATTWHFKVRDMDIDIVDERVGEAIFHLKEKLFVFSRFFIPLHKNNHLFLSLITI